jgi:uncharacterized membrane protein YcaP (DUF421 family)
MNISWSVIRPLWPVAYHTLAIYLFLIVMLRVLNRRQLGQLNVIDLIVIILLGSAVETAMVNGNTTLQAGIVSAGTLLALNRLFASVTARSKRLRHLVNHGPVLLVHDGRLVEAHMRQVGVTEEDVMEALREREICNLKDVQFAVMETDGAIHVVPRTTAVHRNRRAAEKEHPPLNPEKC